LTHPSQRPPTRLELLAEEAGIDPFDLRVYLLNEVERRRKARTREPDPWRESRYLAPGEEERRWVEAIPAEALDALMRGVSAAAPS
jgi:hypothetical protein